MNTPPAAVCAACGAAPRVVSDPETDLPSASAPPGVMRKDRSATATPCPVLDPGEAPASKRECALRRPMIAQRFKFYTLSRDASFRRWPSRQISVRSRPLPFSSWNFCSPRPHTAPAFSLLITPQPTGYRLCSSLPPRTLPVRASASLRIETLPNPTQSIAPSSARRSTRGSFSPSLVCKAHYFNLSGDPHLVRRCSELLWISRPPLEQLQCLYTERSISSALEAGYSSSLPQAAHRAQSSRIFGSHASPRVSQQRTFVIHPILPLPQNRHMNRARWKLDRRYATH